MRAARAGLCSDSPGCVQDQLDLLPGFAPAGGEAGPDPDLGFGPPGAGFGGIGGGDGGGAEFVDEESGLSRLNSDDWTRDLVNALPPRQPDESV